MYEQVKKPKENKSRAVVNSVSQKKSNEKKNFGFVDNRPEALAQRKLQKMANNSQQAKIVKRFQKTNNEVPVQRLIVGAEDISLEEEYQRDVGWIGASTMAVALLRGGSEQDVVEFNELGKYKNLKINENIYFVGHGAQGYWSDKNPADVARETGLMLPDGYKGDIVSLSCQSGLESNEGDKDAAVDVFARNLSVKNIYVIGASGNTLHHPSLPTTVRTILPDRYDSHVLPKIISMQAPIDDAWKLQRNLVVDSKEYKEALYPDKVKMLANASVKLSEKFYLDLVEWADQEGHLYPEGHAYRASKS